MHVCIILERVSDALPEHLFDFAQPPNHIIGDANVGRENDVLHQRSLVFVRDHIQHLRATGNERESNRLHERQEGLGRDKRVWGGYL